LTKVTGERPGEKLHEILISEEEIRHTRRRGNFYAIAPMLPELAELAPPSAEVTQLGAEYSSGSCPGTAEETRTLLERHGLLLEQQLAGDAGEMLR
jgi:UDP-glucose 4-epimerase